MAERISKKILDESCANFVCGPDAYRDLPNLIHSSMKTSQKAANIQLSFEETYADIQPVRNASSTEAFVSIMRGCNNMCSFCVVPFTRGRERSRDFQSIVEEIQKLSSDGIKEICLLGQNVNSYHDLSEYSKSNYPETLYSVASGFKNMYKSRDGPGARFSDLLDKVSQIDPEMRIRFTSPHPKDFPDEVLNLVKDRPNICSALHLPAQSGSNSVLERMRRGYTRETYIQLVNNARDKIKNVSISSDFISGFCGESEEEHRDTIRLMEEIKFDQAYMYAYSLREKTHAAHNYMDDVSENDKQRRLQEVIHTFRKNVQLKNDKEVVNRYALVLIDGTAKNSSPSDPKLSGRTDSNKRVIFDSKSLVDLNSMVNYDSSGACLNSFDELISSKKTVVIPVQGDFIIAKIDEARGHTLRGHAIAKSSISNYNYLKNIYTQELLMI